MDFCYGMRCARSNANVICVVVIIIVLWRLSYIKWTRDHFPTDGSRALELIERATAEFVQDSRYTADERYVRLWIEYVGVSGVHVCL